MILILWTKFIAASLALLFFGYKASRFGYRISKITLFSETFIGMVFLAISTSMPEMFASIGSASIVESSNLAVGNIFGTLIINLMIIVLLDIIRKGKVLSDVENQHVFSGMLCVMLLGFLITSMVLQNLFTGAYKIFHIGLDSIFIFIIYVVCLKLLFKFSYRNMNNHPNNIVPKPASSIFKLWVKFFICIFLVGLLGFYIANISDKIVKNTTYWNHAYFGTIFLAISSSLPEIIVSISSVAAGSINMAIGNIFGSNLFDTIIIPISDMFFTKGIILKDISSIHMFTAIVAIILTCIVIIGLIYKPKKSFARLSWPTICMIFVFIGYYLLFTKLTH